jgi:hypothetical protein
MIPTGEVSPVTARLRIGILGAARIADEGIVAPARTLGHELVAVAARDRARGEAFAAERGIATVHDTYADVIADPDVDLVYNALVNPANTLIAVTLPDASAVAELPAEQFHRHVDAECGDLVRRDVVHDAVRHIHRLTGGRHAEELAGVGADEVRFQCGLSLVGDQRLDLRGGVERLGVQPGDEVAYGLPASRGYRRPDDLDRHVVVEVGGEVGPGDERIRVRPHDH